MQWLATRSLGKECSCNGWALGALIAEPALLDGFVSDVLQEHQYNCGGALQWAMAESLEPKRWSRISGSAAASCTRSGSS